MLTTHEKEKCIIEVLSDNYPTVKWINVEFLFLHTELNVEMTFDRGQSFTKSFNVSLMSIDDIIDAVRMGFRETITDHA